ncbi:MAG: GNAT family N-acetyltransferase [Lachnospiraceae bacterium]
MLKAVIFDMDGVLVDSEPVHFAADRKMLEDNFNIELSYEDYSRYIGSTIEKLWKFFREKYKLFDYEWKELMEMAENVLSDMTDGCGYPAVEGAAELVMELKEKGYLLAVASSSPMSKIEKNLRQLGIYELFDKKISGMEIENPKPHPDIFLKAASMLSVKPSECIVIEDSKNGVLSAKTAGMACLGFINPNSGNQDLSKADYLFEDFLSVDEPFIRMVHNHCFGEPWYVLETERLRIREMCPDDIDDLIRIYSHHEITRYMEGLFDREEELEYMKQYIENIYGFYGYGMWIVEKKDKTVIGRAGIEFYDSEMKRENQITGVYRASKGFSGEDCKTGYEAIGKNMENTGKITARGNEYCHLLGYVIGAEYQNKGYGYEACRAVINYGINNLELSEIKVNIDRDNDKSIRLAKRLGFEFQ